MSLKTPIHCPKSSSILALISVEFKKKKTPKQVKTEGGEGKCEFKGMVELSP